MQTRTKALLWGLATAALFCSLELSWGKVPALGPLFSPFHGFWANLPPKNDVSEWNLQGQDGPIQIQRAPDGIPRVFANSQRDAARGQGYITAFDRLFQVDLQTKLASGRISEVAGIATVALDEERRKMGMTWAAEKMVEAMKKDSQTWDAVTSYVNGFNQRLSELHAAEWPIEYKIMGFRPQPLTPLKVALYAKEMSKELSSMSEDLRMTNNRFFLGDAAITELFANPARARVPIVPSEVGSQDSTKDSQSHTKKIVSQLPTPDKPFDLGPSNLQPNPGNGSNNWAVGPSRSATGRPILADDPHLTMRLPSIWYEIQINTPTLRVLGASLPGLPTVVVGTNQNVAWGVTNGGADVFDSYKVTFQDASQARYLFEGNWEETSFRNEEIKIKGEETRNLKVAYTRQGPVYKTLPDGTSLALRWSAHDPSNDILGFIRLNQSQNFTQALEALKEFSSPVQNFAIISKEGDFGIVHAGKIPLKWENQGLFLLDGSRKDHLWENYLPFEQNPKQINPGRGFVSSANQSPVGEDYPYYMGGIFNATSEARSLRINELLGGKSDWTVQDFTEMQTDSLDKISQESLPVLLKNLKQNDFSPEETEIASLLSQWDYHKSAESIAAAFFEKWIREMRESVWSAHMPLDKGQPPHLDQFVRMIREDPQSRWFDSPKTPEVEEVSHWTTTSFRKIAKQMLQERGALGETWKLEKARPTNILHLARIPHFGHENLPGFGGPTSINATNKSHGPSYRFVTTFGDQGPEYWSVLPGGVSGNPGSALYDSELDLWLKGKLIQRKFYDSPDQIKSEATPVKSTQSVQPSVFARIPWYGAIIALGAMIFSGMVQFSRFSLGFQKSRVIRLSASGIAAAFVGAGWLVSAVLAARNHDQHLITRISLMFGMGNPLFPYAVTFLIPALLTLFYFMTLICFWKHMKRKPETISGGIR